MVAVTQIRIPGTDGRIDFERKIAEGKTKKETLRSLKRQGSNARQLLLDARKEVRGHKGTTHSLRDLLHTLHGRLFGEVTPGPSPTLFSRVLR
jgi:hypothetical protein